MEAAESRPRIIELPAFVDTRGSLSFVEGLRHVPFAFLDTQWVYGVTEGEEVYSCVHLGQEVFIVALTGAFEAVVDGEPCALEHPAAGLYVPAGCRMELLSRSPAAVALLLFASSDMPAETVSDLNAGQPNTVDNCSVIELNAEGAGQGLVSRVENGHSVPFSVCRAFYLYDISDGRNRGEHAHRETYQFLIAASGRFTVTLDDGRTQRDYVLEHPGQGLLVVPGIWNTLRDFSAGSVCLVLTSHGYSEADYLRDYQQFIQYKQCQ